MEGRRNSERSVEQEGKETESSVLGTARFHTLAAQPEPLLPSHKLGMKERVEGQRT